MKILITENQLNKLFVELNEENSFYFDPTTVPDSKWKKISAILTKMGYTDMNPELWKKYFLRLGPRHITHEDHIIAIKKALEPPTPKTDEQKIITKAKRYFGTTNNFESAGYLLIDGSLLNFSGNKFGSFGSKRQMDHRQINEIGINMVEFMAMGNIRTQSYGIDITQMPTKQQIKTLLRFFSNINKSIIIDFTVKGEYRTEFFVEYPEKSKPQRIIYDIINYYRNNVRPVPKLAENINEETEAELDFYDYNHEILWDVLHHIRTWTKIPPFKVINPIQYKSALNEFIKYGEFLRFPTKIILDWKKLVLHNIALLGVLTEINGHSTYFPHEEIYDAFQVPDENQTYNFDKDWIILFGDKDPDDILPTFSNGQPVVSDFGIGPLYILAKQLVNQQKPEDIIVTINKILDVAHQRSDLPELFIKGGSESQYAISNLNEMAYPSSFDFNVFKNLTKFSHRKKYCDERLKKLASGSSRIVYLVDNTKVLKLAKNQKGLAQNSIESEHFIHNAYGDIVAECFERDEENNFYVEMELALKCSKNQFKQLVGFDFSLIFPYLTNHFKTKSYKFYPISDENKQMLDNNEWMNRLTDLVGTYDMAIGDFDRISSYGIVQRDGQSRVVLIDFGCTSDIYEEYYS